jgi:hypothetical protein
MVKTDIEKYQIHFRHFAMRLFERFDILITFDEYVDLCKNYTTLKEQKHKFKNGKTHHEGFIEIKGKLIFVIKNPNTNILITTFNK